MADPQVKALARRIALLEKQMLAKKQANLGYSTIDGGALQANDDDENQTMVIGQQFDGTNAPAVLLSPEPPVPFTPDVTAVPGGLVIGWRGTYADSNDFEDMTIISPMDWARVDVVVTTEASPDYIAIPPVFSFTSPRGGEIFVALPGVEHKVALITRTIAGRASLPSVHALGTPLSTDASQLETFSPLAPTASDAVGLDDGYKWWQVVERLDESGNPTGNHDVLGFWRLVSGDWEAQEIFNVEAMSATNAFIEYLTGKTLTGATVQTRAIPDRGIKLGQVQGSTNYDEAFLVFNNSGVPFIKAVPDEELAVIAGEVKSTTSTVTEGASMGGILEITRGPVNAENPSGSPGAVRLTAYTTAPKSAPTVTTGYDTMQFFDDGLWGNRRGWDTDGTYWYTVRKNSAGYVLERWLAAGTLDTSYQNYSGTQVYGCAYYSGSIYVLYKEGLEFWVKRHNSSTLAVNHVAVWTHNDGLSRDPAIGIDPSNGDILLAQSRPTNSDRVRIRRYTMPGVVDDPLVSVGTTINSVDAYVDDLSGVLYGAFDIGSNSYIFANTVNGQFHVLDSLGTEAAYADWQAGMGAGKVGFAYTGGAFKSMDQGGLMRTYTGQDRLVAIGSDDLTKWISNDLANVSYATDQSPRAKIVMPKRTKLNITTSAINTTGANSPDRVRIYVGRGATDPGRTKMERQGGLWTGPVLTNIYPDPSFETAATGWTAVSGSTTPALSTEQSWVGLNSLKTQRGAGTAAGIAQRTLTSLLTSGAGAYSYAIRVFIPTGVSTTGNTGIRITGTGTTTQDKDTDVRGQWATLTGTFTWDGVNNVFLQALDSAITAGIVIYLDAIHLVAGSTVPTIYAEGSGSPTSNPIGITSGSYSLLIAPSGTNPATNPPAATNGFAAAGGTVQALEQADGTKIIDGLGKGSPWDAYTPSFTAVTTAPNLANFTREGRWARMPRNTIKGTIVLTCTGTGGTGGVGTGAYEIGLPVAPRDIKHVVVTANQSGPNHSYTGRCNSGSVVTLYLTATDSVANSTTTGMTTGTELRIDFEYEAAA